MRLCPRNRDQLGVSVWILHPRHIGYQHRFELHGVQMPPAPLFIAVDMQAFTALGITPCLGATSNEYFHSLGLHIHLYLLHKPGRFQFQCSLEEVGVFHPPVLLQLAWLAQTSSTSFCQFCAIKFSKKQIR